MEEDTIVKIKVPDLPPIDLPIIYKENKDGSFSSNSWYESMSLSAVVEHENSLFRLRLPNAKDYIDKSIKVTVRNASEQPGKTSFQYERDPVLNYRRLQIKKDPEGSLPSDILDPIHDALELAASGSTNVYGMVDNDENGTKNITIDCFAIELGSSAHYLTYIAGQWYISFSNFFKFFSEDYRRKNIDDIADKVKKIDSKGTFKYYVHKDSVDALLVETYPIWSGFNEDRLALINGEFFSVEQVKQIIKDHMSGKSTNGIAPYPDTQWERGPGKAFEKEQTRILKHVDTAFWKYVSLRPAWDTKERFDSLFQGLKLNPEDYYQYLTPTIQEDPDYDPLADMDDDTPPPVNTTYIFTGISYTAIKGWVGDTLEKYVKKYIEIVLKKNGIMEEDMTLIINKFFTEDLTSLTLFKLQEAMQNQANIRPGKFALFVTLAKAAGVDVSDDNPEEVIADLKAQLKEAQTDLESLALRKGYLLRFINESVDPGVAEDQDRAADESTEIELTREAAEFEIQDIDAKLAELTKPKKNKIMILKRQIHAMQDPQWVTMKHVLKRIGVDATNKAAVKLNAVYTIQEFYDMLTKFSGNANSTRLSSMLKEQKARLAQLRAENTVDSDTIESKINAIRDELNETHTNSGYPDTLPPVPQKYLIHKPSSTLKGFLGETKVKN